MTRVSNFIHDNIFEADTLRCSLPYGDLVVEESDDPFLLITAGIGCTPIIGALNHLVQVESIRPATVLHADQSMTSHAHRQEMAELVRQLPGGQLHHWYEQLGAHPEPGLIPRLRPCSVQRRGGAQCRTASALDIGGGRW
ncbi:MAG: hypothetical protein L0J17_13385 [Brevibacterium sp.]|uniref:hypothetical protein n=1 Tax=Brevibacterium sp. TaxID=1701 RepID=UPI00264873DF|nr:hypothetical protein [Brevibacterium sp.]MDN5834981.1 hypothetical protein [Brevibacterium sp.]MDN5910542.1 hypothetical protein [Brevibacterium sp.]MDN6134688.1 hypothetical protein [Brevibacterium sp.]MDN6158783.1 hypothetical protein [Brevibacterium sp.]MDN6176372.1 hypothetical protein [Brevibacterium sp.]